MAEMSIKGPHQIMPLMAMIPRRVMYSQRTRQTRQPVHWNQKYTSILPLRRILGKLLIYRNYFCENHRDRSMQYSVQAVIANCQKVFLPMILDWATTWRKLRYREIIFSVDAMKM